MVRRAYRQRSLIEVLLPDAAKLWDPTLRRIDALLDDEVPGRSGGGGVRQKVAALTPRPRINLVLYHGVLAPHAGWRARGGRVRRPTG